MPNRAQDTTAVSDAAAASGKIRPATPLPWEQEIESPGCILSKPDDWTVVTESFNEPRGPIDARYIVHACNNYERLVAELENAKERMWDYAMNPHARRIEAILRELGEL